MAGKRIIYKTADGKRVPSVTTILNRFKDSGGLLYWANQQGLDGITLEEARQAPANAGTLAHELVEHYVNGWDKPDHSRFKPEIVKPAERAFQNFQRWQDDSKIEFVHTEVSLVSEHHRFGMRLDAIGQGSNMALAIVDFKTGGLYADHILQVAGYKLGWEENYPDRELVGGAHLISFKRETADFGHHYFGDLHEEEQTFIAMRELYDRVKAVEKRAK